MKPPTSMEETHPTAHPARGPCQESTPEQSQEVTTGSASLRSIEKKKELISDARAVSAANTEQQDASVETRLFLHSCFF